MQYAATMMSAQVWSTKTRDAFMQRLENDGEKQKLKYERWNGKLAEE